ncbi:MAG: flagellar hook-associated protein FlgK [Alphaproteobacteria bacterium]|nr:MAG: flagellar hook-associated protein FlgK [Alphaproteobacteria bacterium]
MSNLTNALRIGTSGMQYSQLALGTVSHNVVNANTAGYSRQIVQSSAASLNGFGAGVQLESVQRVSDRFLNSRVLTATSDSSYAASKSSYLSSLEDTFTTSNASGGLESVVGMFITSMNNLATDPSNSSLRRNVVQQASLVAGAIKSVNDDLSTVATDADNSITAELDVMNQLVKDIYQLNTQIVQLQAGGNGAGNNDLMDARDQKIKQLSQSMGVQVNYNTSTGGVRVATEDGRRLVDENSYVQFSRNTSGGEFRSIVAQSVQSNGTLSNTKMPIEYDNLSTGRIKALMEVRDVTVPALKAQVDQFTSVFTSEVNRLTSQGTSSPPAFSLNSGNTHALATGAADLLATTRFSGINGTTINISVTTSLGTAVTTSSGTPIALAPTLPATTLSLNDIADIINNDPTVGNTALGGTQGVIASVVNTAQGPELRIEAANANNKVVMANVTGDALGMLGMNNLFTGSNASDVGIRADIATNADLLPVAFMRADGGVSNTDGQNIIKLAGLADLKLTFAAAGGLGGQQATAVSYLNTMSSTLAVNVSAASDNSLFASNLQNQAQELATSVSGVNINEELAQMLVFQSSFQASARIISVVNDLLQELVNIV